MNRSSMHAGVWDALIEPINQCAHLAWQGLYPQLLTPWADRPVHTSIVNDQAVNAAAMQGNEADHVLLYRGLVERVLGYALALFGTREFLPGVGDARKECTIERAAKFFEQRYDLRTGTAPLCPVCSTRKELASGAALLALNVALLHELGHIVGGHFQLLRGGYTSVGLDEIGPQTRDVPLEVPLSVVEWDADCFAASFSDILQGNMEPADDFDAWFSGIASDPRYLGVILLALGAHILFRCLTTHEGYTYAFDVHQYPPPPLRGFNFVSELVLRRDLREIDAGRQVIRISKMIEEVCARRFGSRLEDSQFFGSMFLSPVMWDAFSPCRQRLEEVRRVSYSWRPLYRP